MKMSELKFEKIENYDPFNSRANANGMAAAILYEGVFTAGNLF